LSKLNIQITTILLINIYIFSENPLWGPNVVAYGKNPLSFLWQELKLWKWLIIHWKLKHLFIFY